MSEDLIDRLTKASETPETAAAEGVQELLREAAGALAFLRAQNDLRIQNLTMTQDQIEARIQDPTRAVEMLAGAFWRLLEQHDAKNYIEMTRHKTGHGYVIVTLQRQSGATPHELRQKAEALVLDYDQRLTATRNALRAAGVPEVVPYNQSEIEAADENRRTTMAAGRCLSEAERVEFLARMHRDTLGAFEVMREARDKALIRAEFFVALDHRPTWTTDGIKTLFEVSVGNVALAEARDGVQELVARAAGHRLGCECSLCLVASVLPPR